MSPDLPGLLQRLVSAVERLAPPTLTEVDLGAADAFVWEAQAQQLRPVAAVAGVPLELLVGIDRVRDILLANTERFAAGRVANNALLWGARGMGKSSLIKAIHGRINGARPHALALIEIHREDIDSLPRLLQHLHHVRIRPPQFGHRANDLLDVRPHDPLLRGDAGPEPADGEVAAAGAVDHDVLPRVDRHGELELLPFAEEHDLRPQAAGHVHHRRTRRPHDV